MVVVGAVVGADLAWAPVLARLFTAIFSQKRSPCHFAVGHHHPPA
jgi:hypothetical protein